MLFCCSNDRCHNKNPHIPAISVLFIDDNQNHRTYWAGQLKRCAPDYEILKAPDSQSGLALFRSRRIDCVVLELSLPNQSVFPTLMELVPRASRPQVAVVVLTLMMSHPSVWRLAKENDAYACLVNEHSSGEELHRAIQRAIAFGTDAEGRSKQA